MLMSLQNTTEMHKKLEEKLGVSKHWEGRVNTELCNGALSYMTKHSHTALHVTTTSLHKQNDLPNQSATFKHA